MKKLTWKDGIVALVFAAVLVPYVGYVIRGDMPFVKDAPEGWLYSEPVRVQMLRRSRRDAPESWTRLHGKLARTERRGPSVIWTVGVQVEIEGKEKPALVGEVVYMAAGMPDA